MTNRAPLASDLALVPVPPFPASLMPVAGGEWAGWYKWHNVDPFEDLVGPFHVGSDAQGVVCGWRPGPHSRNGHGIIHGGAMMTFADFSLFMLGSDGQEQLHGVTVSMNTEFLSAARAGELLLARGERTGGGRNLVFVRGMIAANSRPVLNFSGVVKRLKAG